MYKYPQNIIHGWMTPTELQWLYSMAMKHKTIVEIGCWKGRSTHALLTGAEKCGGFVTVVDHFQGAKGQEAFFPEVAYQDMYHVFMANLGHFDNLKVLKMKSLEGVKYVDQTEMTFIDGSHDYQDVLDDIDAWMPKTTKMLCGHDYTFPEVKKAVMERFGVPKILCDSIWAVER